MLDYVATTSKGEIDAMTDNPIGLADAIATLRAELSRARKEGEGKDVHFATGEITVELAVEFGATAEVGVGAKLLSLVNVSTKAGASGKAAHKITLKLEIADENGGLLIAGDGGRRSNLRNRRAVSQDGGS